MFIYLIRKKERKNYTQYFCFVYRNQTTAGREAPSDEAAVRICSKALRCVSMASRCVVIKCAYFLHKWGRGAKEAVGEEEEEGAVVASS